MKVMLQTCVTDSVDNFAAMTCPEAPEAMGVPDALETIRYGVAGINGTRHLDQCLLA